jgi:hypothetical protein
MKTYGEWRYSSTILELNTRWISQLKIQAPSLSGEISGIHWARGCAGSRGGFGIVEKRKVTCPGRETNPRLPVCCPSL